MERFVQAIVAGGLALLAGLWTVTVASPGSSLWFVGAGLVVLGISGLGVGIWTEIER